MLVQRQVTLAYGPFSVEELSWFNIIRKPLRVQAISYHARQPEIRVYILLKKVNSNSKNRYVSKHEAGGTGSGGTAVTGLDWIELDWIELDWNGLTLLECDRGSNPRISHKWFLFFRIYPFQHLQAHDAHSVLFFFYLKKLVPWTLNRPLIRIFAVNSMNSEAEHIFANRKASWKRSRHRHIYDLVSPSHVYVQRTTLSAYAIERLINSHCGTSMTTAPPHRFYTTIAKTSGARESPTTRA